MKTQLSSPSLHSHNYNYSNEMRDKAYNICREFLSGSWKKINSDDMIFESVSGGLSNELFYCSLPSTHTPLLGEPSQVLLRMYGQLHSDINSKMTESLIFMLLSERKLGPKLYGIFPGGRLEEYLPARAMTNSDLKDPTFSKIIARKLASVHNLDMPINKEPTWLFDTMYSYLDFIRSKIDTSMIRDKEKFKMLLEFDFDRELRWLKHFLSGIKSPVVFSHNDLQQGNILLPKSSNCMQGKQSYEGVVFIDFEYCSYNYRGFDIGNHFCEWSFDYTNPNYPNFWIKNGPSTKQKRQFIKEYIKNNPKCHNDELDSEDHILQEAEYYMLASHMLWVLWSIQNGYSSQIEFGYLKYGRKRLNAYLNHKRILLGRVGKNGRNRSFVNMQE